VLFEFFSCCESVRGVENVSPPPHTTIICKNKQTKRIGASTAFAEKHLLTWVHGLTKIRRKTWHPVSILFLSSFALNHSLLQPPWNQERTGMMDNIFTITPGIAEPCRTDHPPNS
jgi:hypothetical protein